MFELEAERLRNLNKGKVPDTTPWYLKLVYWIAGGGLALLFLTALTAYNLFSVGFVGMKLWQWFIVPAFNVAQMSLIHMMGIVLLLRVFTFQFIPKSKKSDDETFKERLMTFLGLLLAPWFILLVGYIVHCFV